MSGTVELLADCYARGIHLQPARDGGLSIDAPQAALTPELVAQLKAHKAELLALLAERAIAQQSDDKPREKAAEAQPQEPSEPPLLGPDGWPADTVELPAACRTCGGIDLWWDWHDEPHCRGCHPPRYTAPELQKLAARLRAKARPGAHLGADRNA